MKNKILFIFLLLILIILIPSFCYAATYEDGDTSVTFPDFEFPEGTTDYVIFDYGDNRDYSIFGFSDKETALKCHLLVSGRLVLFVVPSGVNYWCASYDAAFSSQGWVDFSGREKFEWITSTRNSFTVGHTAVNYHAIYTTFDIKNESGDIVFEDNTKLKLNLSVSPSEETSNVPVLVTSDWYLLEKWNTSLEVFTENQMYDVYMHIPQVENPIGIDDKVCSVEVSKDEKGRNIYRYVYKVYKNGTYRFKLTDINGLVDSDIEEPSSKYVIEQTVEIDNIVASQDTVDNYVDGRFDPTPFLGYEYVSDTEIYITTQKFFMHELIDLQCFIAKDIDIKKDFNDSSKWTKIDVRTFKDEISQDDVYQFYYSVKNDNFDGNGTYYVKFYNVFLDKYRWSSIDIDFDKILAVDGSWLFKYVSFFRERFGFLVYPFDLAINVLNKVKNIQFEEPAFDIPQINEPFTKQKLISATHFSFNDLLENEVFNNIHNIYLAVVDVIIGFGLANLLRHKIMGVFEK